MENLYDKMMLVLYTHIKNNMNFLWTCVQALDLVKYKKKLGVTKFDTVVIANGEDFADALSGSYLAGKKKAPMLRNII